MSRVTSKGQITIPKPIRDAFGLEEGTRLEFEIEGEALRLRKVRDREVLDRWRGTVDLPAGVDEFVDDLRGER